MFAWLRNKTELQKLQYKYCRMIKNAYKLALTDKKRSDQLHEKASELLSQIKKMESQSIL